MKDRDNARIKKQEETMNYLRDIDFIKFLNQPNYSIHYLISVGTCWYIHPAAQRFEHIPIFSAQPCFSRSPPPHMPQDGVFNALHIESRAEKISAAQIKRGIKIMYRYANQNQSGLQRCSHAVKHAYHVRNKHKPLLVKTYQRNYI